MIINKIIFLTSFFIFLFLSTSAFAQQWGDFRYTESDNTITVIKYTGSAEEIKLPSTIEGKPVVRIGKDAFQYSTTLASLTIPESITSIGAGAFWGCSGLSSVTIPDSVASIEAGAFAACTGLLSVSIPAGVTRIGAGIFCMCASLTTIDVDQDNPFYSSQDGVLYTKDQTELLQYPAGKNGGFSLPDSVISVGDYAFRNCTGLTSVTIPGSVLSIGYGAFSYCTGLSGVTIDEGVSIIQGTAFYGCSGLIRAYFLGNAPEMGSDVFADCAQGFTVYFAGKSTGFTAPRWMGYSAAPSGSSSCPAENILGSDTQTLKKLRAFRDGPLARSEAGRRITRMYYDYAGSITATLERTPALRAPIRLFFESVARLADNEQ